MRVVIFSEALKAHGLPSTLESLILAFGPDATLHQVVAHAKRGAAPVNVGDLDARRVDAVARSAFRDAHDALAAMGGVDFTYPAGVA